MSKAKTLEFNVEKWASLYDTLRYPPSIYEELVVEGRTHPQRFNILGAWKTGCIASTGSGEAYTDANGDCYFFSNRWRADCPVGYRVWNDLSRNDAEVAAEVPTRLTSQEPPLIARLRRRRGFGLIWAVFVLHCVRPEQFPLYDQHVYRAYRQLETDRTENPAAASSSWRDYYSYAKWFIDVVDGFGQPYGLVDRALWTFGKSVKVYGKPRSPSTLPPLTDLAGEWVHDTTFGGKKKPFWWRIDGRDLVLARRFRGGRTLRIRRVSAVEIDQLQVFMSDDERKSLSNNVAKLDDGSEKPGIGKFLADKLGWSATEAQLAGHIGVVLTHSGVWDYNQQKVNIKHWRIEPHWRPLLLAHYRERAADINQG